MNRNARTILAALAATTVAYACGSDGERAGEAGGEAEVAEGMASTARPGAYIVDIQMTDYAFAMPREIPSGWITFRAPNHGREHHVAVFLRLPEGVTQSDWTEGLRELHATGTPPEWWDRLEDAGGTGAIAPGLTSQNTIPMEPGLYGVLCGVIARDGTSHWGHGMQTTFEVTEEPSGAPEPEATVRLSLGADGTVERAVELMEHPIEPFPFDFIGGAEQGPEGRTDYFTATFEPGRYAWICHLHAADGMVREFTVG